MTWFKTEAGVLVNLDHAKVISRYINDASIGAIDFEYGGRVEITSADFSRLEAMVMPPGKTSGTFGGLSDSDLAKLNESLKIQREFHRQMPDNSMQASIASMIEDPGRGRTR
jgi:hypothetical protein